MNLAEVMTHEQGTQLIFSREVATRLGVTKALILERLRFWQQWKREHPDRDDGTAGDADGGDPWVWNSLTDWQGQFPFLSRSKLYRALTELEADGYIESCRPGASRWHQRKSYRVCSTREMASCPSTLSYPSPQPSQNGNLSKINKIVSLTVFHPETELFQGETATVPKRPHLPLQRIYRKTTDTDSKVDKSGITPIGVSVQAAAAGAAASSISFGGERMSTLRYPRVPATESRKGSCDPPAEELAFPKRGRRPMKDPDAAEDHGEVLKTDLKVDVDHVIQEYNARVADPMGWHHLTCSTPQKRRLRTLVQDVGGLERMLAFFDLVVGNEFLNGEKGGLTPRGDSWDGVTPKYLRGICQADFVVKALNGGFASRTERATSHEAGVGWKPAYHNPFPPFTAQQEENFQNAERIRKAAIATRIAEAKAKEEAINASRQSQYDRHAALFGDDPLGYRIDQLEKVIAHLTAKGTDPGNLAKAQKLLQEAQARRTRERLAKTA